MGTSLSECDVTRKSPYNVTRDKRFVFPFPFFSFEKAYYDRPFVFEKKNSRHLLSI